MIAEVIVLAPLDRPLSYRVPPGMALAPGDRVRVPLGARAATGVVRSLGGETAGRAATGLKPVLAPLGASGLDLRRIEAILEAAAEFLTPPGPLLALALPPDARAGGGKFLRLAKREGAAPLGLLALRPLFSRPVEPAAKLRKALGPSRYEREVTSLIAAGWIEALDERPRASGFERWVKWNPDAPPLPRRQRRAAALQPALGEWRRLSELYESLPGAKSLVPALVKSDRVQVEKRPLPLGTAESLAVEAPPPGLNDEQRSAVAALSRAIAARAPEKFLLTGPTGSGKTAVFIAALKAAASAGRPGLLLVPEINLIPQALARLRGVFGERIAVFHSEMADGARAAAWARVRSGAVEVVVGVRSGLFAPLAPGLIVIDEEQASSYRQSTAPAYSARALALKFAALAPCPLLLASATPSVESRYAAREAGPFAPLRLTERAGGARLPEAVALDMRGAQAGELFHPELLEALRGALGRGEKAILLRNRRGWAPQLTCRTCGLTLSCGRCAVALTLHRDAGREFLLCHLCGGRRARPAHCPGCGGDYLVPYGAGTQRLLDEALEKIPGAKPLRLDRDSVRGARGAAEILTAFREGDANLLVGTQMLAKGHDIPGVTVVGVLAADGLLGLPDFRAAERLFGLLTQAIGRAGRGAQAGTAYIQALSPDHYAVKRALAQDFEGFFADEIRLRKLGGYPPFGVVARIVAAADDAEAAFARCDELARRLQALAADLALLGPAFCPLEKVRGKFRAQLILKAKSRPALAARLREFLPEKLPAGVRVEMDPESLV